MSARILGASVARFRSNPLAGRTAPAVTATWDEGRGRLTSGPFTWDVDLPRVVGGRNEAPSPTLYLLGALAGCAGAVIHDTLAPQLGVRVTGVSAVARCRSDLAGMLGVNGADPHLTGFAIEIAIESPESRERIETLRHAWSQRCPIYLSLLNPIAVDITWT